MDNVYAYDYVKNANAMPASLAAIKVNDRLELCGELYTSGSPGIHWVHSNCGATPSTSAPTADARMISSALLTASPAALANPHPRRRDLPDQNGTPPPPPRTP